MNLWVGRLLVTGARDELNGPFYAATYESFKTPLTPQTSVRDSVPGALVSMVVTMVRPSGVKSTQVLDICNTPWGYILDCRADLINKAA